MVQGNHFYSLGAHNYISRGHGSLDLAKFGGGQQSLFFVHFYVVFYNLVGWVKSGVKLVSYSSAGQRFFLLVRWVNFSSKKPSMPCPLPWVSNDRSLIVAGTTGDQQIFLTCLLSTLRYGLC